MSAKKPKRGRPVKEPEDRKSAELRIRLTDDERALLDRAAGGDNTSTWARDLLIVAADRQVSKEKK